MRRWILGEGDLSAFTYDFIPYPCNVSSSRSSIILYLFSVCLCYLKCFGWIERSLYIGMKRYIDKWWAFHLKRRSTTQHIDKLVVVRWPTSRLTRPQRECSLDWRKKVHGALMKEAMRWANKAYSNRCVPRTKIAPLSLTEPLTPHNSLISALNSNFLRLTKHFL